MSKRNSREAALQAIFQVYVGGLEADFALQYLIDNDFLAEKDIKYAKILLEGILKNKVEIDNFILTYLKEGWRPKRLAKVDRNILRLAVYELLYQENIPAIVSINEAIDLAKAFGGEDSGKFINGLLATLLSSEKYLDWVKENIPLKDLRQSSSF